MKKLNFLALFALLAIFSFTFPIEETANQTTNGHIKGVVLDEAMGTPVEGIEVKAHMSKGKYHDEAVTDSNGKFLLELKPGTYDLMINYQGQNSTYDSQKITGIEVKENKYTIISASLPYPGK